LGINHISSPDEPTSEERYRNALLLGAGWNRWPLYWDRVEVAPGQFTWSAYDRVVAEDIRHGLSINAILLGRPSFYRDEARITGMHNPIFADGTDTPSVDKTINPDNPWANYVYQTVSRYKPGGVLAQSRAWTNGEGIRVWEVWNEPDYQPFWGGSIGDYARLLKIAYLVAKMVDPEAKVMFGGLLYPSEDNWLARVLAIYVNDPFHEQYNWYMDIVAVHNYSYPWRSGWLVLYARQTLISYGIRRPIWLNESGTPVWDDYPGPIWAKTPQERALRSTSEQQAAFFIQSTAYAWSEGAEVVFYHQLYDDCGNQPGGTNFPVHNGELCINGNICAGDAFGLFRNEIDSVCFSQHPFPGTPRRAAAAFHLMAEVFGKGEMTNPKVQNVAGKAIVISFDRPESGERNYVIWNRTLENAVLDFPASADSGTLLALDEDYLLNANGEGIYEIGLPPATHDDFPFLQPGDITAVGGLPYILIEKPIDGLTSEVTPEVETFGTPEGGSNVPLQVTPGAVIGEPARPTVDPALDKTPPTASVSPLPEVSPPVFTVTWTGKDDSGIERYTIWVRVDGGQWTPWIETTRSEGQYTGEPGKTYEFAAWALDLGGNWSTNTDLQPQAITRVQ
jgi:hypothetical protein